MESLIPPVRQSDDEWIVCSKAVEGVRLLLTFLSPCDPLVHSTTVICLTSIWRVYYSDLFNILTDEDDKRSFQSSEIVVLDSKSTPGVEECLPESSKLSQEYFIHLLPLKHTVFLFFFLPRDSWIFLIRTQTYHPGFFFFKSYLKMLNKFPELSLEIK